MQSLDDAIISDAECASLVIETVLLGMGAIRAEMRAGRPSDLTVPQFRVLAFLSHHEGASLSDVAEHIGLTLPSMSRAIDWLVRQKLVDRAPSVDDRRRVTLNLTEEGSGVFRSVADATRDRMAAMLASLSPDERAEVVRGMNILRSVLPLNRRGLQPG
jgi:DNA-binding MarR family transcriptional regulator